MQIYKIDRGLYIYAYMYVCRRSEISIHRHSYSHNNRPHPYTYLDEYSIIPDMTGYRCIATSGDPGGHGYDEGSGAFQSVLHT